VLSSKALRTRRTKQHGDSAMTSPSTDDAAAAAASKATLGKS